MMAPVTPWIAILAERCLSFYLGRPDDGIQVVDCGSSLAFSFGAIPPKTAIVVTWGQGDSNCRATFTDSQNQIEAVVSRKSPNVSGEASLCPPSVKGGPRHLVELPEIKLVFTYSASTPELELHIGRFQIHQNAFPKGDAPKPKLRKETNLKPLIAQAYRKAQKNPQESGSHHQTGAAVDNKPLSRPNSINVSQQSQIASGSQGFHSQAPLHNLHDQSKSHSNTNRVSLGGSAEILAFYANHVSAQGTPVMNKTPGAPQSSPGRGGRQTSPSNEDTEFAVPKKPAVRHPQERSTAQSRSGQNVGLLSEKPDATHTTKSRTESVSISSDENNGTRGLAGAHTNHTERSATRGPDADPIYTAEGGDKQQPSKKRQRESLGAQPQTTHDKDMCNTDPQDMEISSPSNKRQRTNAEEAAGVANLSTEWVSSVSGAQGISSKSGPTDMPTINHWEGMTKIPANEVDIPKDQAELLEQLKWFPQEPGVSALLCHVPPHLLSRWNEIARKRHLKANQPEPSPERPVTPTPQGTNPSTADYSSEGEKLSWDESSREGSPENALPEDTPPRHIVALVDTQDSASQTKENDTGDMESGTQNRSPSVRAGFAGSETVSNTTGEGLFKSPDKLKLNTVQRHERATGNVSSPSLKFSKSLDARLDDEPSTPIQHSPRKKSSSRAMPVASGPQDRQNVDGSDDSADEMEAAVPFALGQSVPLSSQPQHETTSSGSSLPGMAEGRIQVIETPIASTTRLRKKKRASREIRSSQPLPSEDPKTSPSSRIRNTYCSQESQNQSLVSSGANNSSQSDKQRKSPRVSGLGLQAPSQATPQSSSEIVLDSSKSTRHQRGSSIFHLESDDASSFPFPNSHPPAISHSNEISQDDPKSQGNINLDSSMSAPPSQPPRAQSSGDNDQTRDDTHNPNAEIVTRRQSYLGQADKSAEAQLIYDNFCNTYPPYSGEFSHFADMCSRLHTTRENGFLKRSFLWDDFIILHLTDWPNYLGRNASQPSRTMSYEEYFCATFLRPRYKKRNLTAGGIDVAASQSVIPVVSESLPVSTQVTTKENPNQNQPAESEDANPSFTASLVDQFSGLHARSFDHTDTGHSPDPLKPTTARSSILPSEDTDSYDSSESDSSGSDSSDSDSISIKEEPDDSSMALDASHASQVNQDREMATPTQPGTHLASPASTKKSTNKGGNDEADIDDMPETDDTHHETASIELGDDNNDRHTSVTRSISPVAALINNFDTEPQREKKRNWFSSLKNILPPKNTLSTNPRWSHDPNTPFKRWAHQDQNVLQEINRRGGTKVLLDERGLICRPTYNRELKDRLNS
ncbi:unnamed protein product [Penicillium salamii]|uniref:Telomere replication protein EST3 n=1 Tax=Penicillium salamii TaxID=1612424 RepID=A0A9W4IPL4_9EURO|nr:unnamed protein product [Penicillium salamii]CAG8027510.1 unnamed protein product [Penicillium salamii]CAG8036711.1 unnamed protein product [Penicillium salamii]CAG8058644.1 unnamed protein product [Penicillium salamii]CAG8086570.1 unnamed protein product [Penicillium salamii]